MLRCDTRQLCGFSMEFPARVRGSLPQSEDVPFRAGGYVRLDGRPGRRVGLRGGAEEVHWLASLGVGFAGLEQLADELRVKGRRVPEWDMYMNSAGPLPQSPVKSSEPIEELTLIPYGCAKLRITEFPLLEG